MAQVSKEPMENTGSKPIKAHSTFVNGYPLAGTYRFGELSPHFVMDCVPDDKISLTSKHQLGTYTLGVPLMQDLRIKKDYFFIPDPAILPFNYEKFITNPNIGDDVNAELVGTSVNLAKISQYISTGMIAIIDAWASIDPDDPDSDSMDSILTGLFKYALVSEMVFSNGGLLASLGCHLLTKEQSQIYDNFWQLVRSLVDNNSYTFVVNRPSPAAPEEYSNVHYLHEALRDDFDWTLSFSSSSDTFDFLTDILGADGIGQLILDPDDNYSDVFSYYNPSKPDLINIKKCFAYQIACAQFFTNDKVDYIYSAELYRQSLFDLWCTINQGTDALTFSYNGVSYQYDFCSAIYFNTLVPYLADFTDDPFFSSTCDYLRAIFGFNRSLRHVDYFTGSRTRPLAVGDVNVKVNAGYVNVVDNIQTTWFAKFLNQVNRTGRRLAPYIKGLFPDADIQVDWHDPLWLAHVEDKVINEQTENTSTDQFKNVNVSSKMMSNSERYAFEFTCNQYYGTLIGITYFDLERFYSESIERPFFHVDRYDIFNPYLQFNGDQPVYSAELFGSVADLDGKVFGYKGRYLEYKERYPQAFGGFVDDPLLSKYIYLADSDKFYGTEMGLSRSSVKVGPTYIRSNPLELDKYYSSLTGLGLSTYFHFFIINRNHVKSVRPMVANPSLG